MSKKTFFRFETTLDERAQQVTRVGNSLGFVTAAIGLVISLGVSRLFPSLDVLQTLLFMTLVTAALVQISYNLLKNAHPLLLMRSTKMAWSLAGVLLVFGVVIIVMSIMDYITERPNLAQLWERGGVVSFAYLGLSMLVISLFFIYRLLKNRQEELED